MTATLYQSAWARLRCCNKTPKSQGLKTTKVYFSFTPQVLLTKQSHQGQGKEAWQAAPAAQCPAWEGHVHGQHWPTAPPDLKPSWKPDPATGLWGRGLGQKLQHHL